MKIINYVYTNPALDAKDVKKSIAAGKYSPTRVRNVHLPLENFHHVKNGGEKGLGRLEAIEKEERK